jgi:diaminopimelate epimerase
MAEIRFAKYHGTGNDFVMIEDLDDSLKLEPQEIAALCDRRFGIGADGLIRVAAADGADFFMDYHNADGSEAQMCGNGIRCLGKLVADRNLTDRDELEIVTRAGVKRLSLHRDADGSVTCATVGMGTAAFERSAIPMRGPAWETFQMQPIEALGRSFTGTAVSMGNPHIVLFLDEDYGSVDVASFGPALEHHELFPEKTNVEFVVSDGTVLHARVWERGVGETMACGTGACAAAVAANEAGIAPSEVTVRFPGGALTVERRGDGEVTLTGPAVHVFDGGVDPSAIEERRA